jgi:hypothetical protein
LNLLPVRVFFWFFVYYVRNKFYIILERLTNFKCFSLSSPLKPLKRQKESVCWERGGSRRDKLEKITLIVIL